MVDLFWLGAIGIVTSNLVKDKQLLFLSCSVCLVSFGMICLVFKANRLVKKFKFISFSRFIDNVRVNKKTIALPMICSFLCNLNNAIIIGLLFKATHSYSYIFYPIAVFPASTIASVVPVTPLGLGTREATFLYFLNDILPAETIVASSLLYTLLSQILLGICGAIYLSIRSRNSKYIS